MSDTFRDVAPGLQVEQPVDEALLAPGEVDLRRDARGPSGGVVPDRPLQGLEALARVVKVRNRLAQARARQVGQETLESAEGAGGDPRLLRGLDLVETGRIFDEVIGAPAVPGGVAVIGGAIPGGDQLQPAPGGVRFAGHPAGNVRADPGDVLHQGGDVLEHPVVDPLKDIPDAPATLVEGHRIGVIDVPAAMDTAAGKSALKREFSANSREIG